MYYCTFKPCRRFYKNSKSLQRHITEIHSQENKVFTCVITGCKIKLKRRHYLIKHLENVHNVKKEDAKKLTYNINTETVEPRSTSKIGPNTCRSPYRPVVENISEDEIETTGEDMFSNELSTSKIFKSAMDIINTDYLDVNNNEIYYATKLSEDQTEQINFSSYTVNSINFDSDVEKPDNNVSIKTVARFQVVNSNSQCDFSNNDEQVTDGTLKVVFYEH